MLDTEGDLRGRVSMARDEFVAWLRGAIPSLPQTLKEALRIAEDPDVPDEGRALLAGAVIHWLSRTNTIPSARVGTLIYVDDALVLLFALDRLRAIVPGYIERLIETSPELFERFDDDVARAREYLGTGVKVIDHALDRVARLKHMGRTAEHCVHDEAAATMLYEELDSALIDFEVQEEAVARDVKDIDGAIEEVKKRGAAL